MITIDFILAFDQITMNNITSQGQAYDNFSGCGMWLLGTKSDSKHYGVEAVCIEKYLRLES